MLIEVKIRALMMDPNTNVPILILKDVNSEAMIPIWISNDSASAIAYEVEKITPQRPLTHDLIRNLIEGAGARVERVVVTELRDSTYHAAIHLLDVNGTALKIDSRTSDAVAVALRVDCPIFVEEEVFRSSRTPLAEDEEANAFEEQEWPDVIGETGDLPM